MSILNQIIGLGVTKWTKCRVVKYLFHVKKGNGFRSHRSSNRHVTNTSKRFAIVSYGGDSPITSAFMVHC